jgi:choline-sulfatase
MARSQRHSRKRRPPAADSPGAAQDRGAGSRLASAAGGRRWIALAAAGLGLIVLITAGYLLLGRERPRPWASAEAPSEPWNVLLVSLDTTRPDPLEACGGGPVPTPGLDRVLGDGFLFQEMITSAPNTLPAHATLFTGDNPYRHGVRENIEHALPENTPTLAAAFQRAGYATAAFIAAFVLSERFGLAQGFELYEDRLWGPEAGLGPGTVELPGSIIASRTTQYLAGYSARKKRGEEQRPFFLFVHFFDAHTPYRPPMPYAAIYPDQPYHGELAYQDMCLGRVLDALETYDLARNTLVWVVSDHGESLWEHGEATHAIFIYDATMRVVSILRPPPPSGRYEAGRPRLRIGEQTSLIDVAPTLLDLLGLGERGLPAQGHSLVPLLEGGAGGERAVYCETLSPLISYHWAPLYGVRTTEWKYIRAPVEELYDLRKDPGEQTNLAGRRPRDVDRLAAVLDEFLAGTATDLERSRRMPSAEERARLESLGYISSSRPAPAEGTAELPDPKAMIASYYAQQDRAKDYIRNQEYDKAITILEKAVRGDPRNNSLFLYLGNAYRGAGRFEDAGAAYRRSLQIQEHSPRAYSGWGQALFEAGEYDSAAWAFGRAIEQLPSSPDSWIRRAALNWRQGRYAAAAADYDSALARGGYPVLIHGFLARLYRDLLRDPDRGELHLRRFASLRGVPVEVAAQQLPDLGVDRSGDAGMD